jgi:methyltransferase (TIGR00027 family)
MADHTAIRVALWRARHLEVDAAPPVLDDSPGLLLADPESDWRDRPDMDPDATRGARAGMVGRARVVDDLVTECFDAGVTQYVLLGAGLDTYALRHPDLGPHQHLFEVDRPGTSAWKQRRIAELGLRRRRDCASCRPTSSRSGPGGTGSSPPVSMPGVRPSCPRPA